MIAGPGFSIIQSVLHPTDLSESSLVAFHHALKAAMVSKSKLTLLHVSTNGTSEWSHFPGVRETLERWGALPKGSGKAAVATLGIDACKVMAKKGEPVDAVVHYLEHNPTDLSCCLRANAMVAFPGSANLWQRRLPAGLAR